MNELPDEVIAAIRSGHKFAAIKLLRDQTGMGLKEAKATVERYAEARDITLHDVNMPGCFMVLAVLGLVAYLIYYFFFR